MTSGANTALWDAVCKTDPAHTKKFKKGGGFSGTAIKPFWLIHRATETFGPVGIGWGWEEVENKVVAGIWCSRIRLWYLLNNQRGQIEQWGQTEMETERENKDRDGNGLGTFRKFVDEEAPKKAVTDAVTKCLSYLGFAGDVHMGLFDDSKYVDELRSEFKEREEALFASADLRKQFVDNCLEAIGKAASVQNLRDLNDLNMAKWNAMAASKDKADAEAWATISTNFKAKAGALKKGDQPKPVAQTVEAAVKNVGQVLGDDTIPF